MTRCIRSAMILAAGRGERLRPITDQVPKPLLSAGGKTLLDWHLSRLQTLGISRVVINVSYLGHLIEQHVATRWADASFEICFSKEITPLETAGGIANAYHWLNDGPFLVLNGDVWTDANLYELVAHPWPDEAFAHLLLVPNPQHHPQGDCYLRSDRNVRWTPPGQRLTYAGIGVFSPRLFAELDTSAGRLAPYLETWAQQGKVTGQCLSGTWLDVGSPERLAAWRQFMGERGA